MPRPGKVRIIAGQWRSRRIDVVAAPGLRPTPDRVRETLFNWLAPIIDGARCLDCFAGTGALAFEALSRGAGECVMIEQDRACADQLRSQAQRLGADSAEVICGDARQWLNGNPRQFDVIFVDPPFTSDLATETCVLLANGRNLAPAGMLYVETATGWVPPGDFFQAQKQSRAGQVQFMLLATKTGGPA